METNIENKRIFYVTNCDTANPAETNVSKKTVTISASIGSQINSINLNDTQDEQQTNTLVNRFYNLFKKYYGLILAIISTICITCSIFLVKISIVLNASDMAVVTFGVQLVFCIPFGYFFKQNLIGPKSARFLLVTRGLTGVVSILACFFSVKLITFADAISIRSMGFILTAVLAHCFLKEKFTFIHYIAVGLTIMGVLCIVRPLILFKYFDKLWEFDSEASSVTGLSLALFGTLALSSTFIFVKKLTNKDVHFSIIVFYFSLFGFIISVMISSVLFLTGYTHEQWDLGKQFVLRDISLGVLSGLCTMLGHVCFTQAISTENANKIALFRTLDILIAYLLEFLILKTVPNVLSLAGSSLILISVLIIFVYKLMILKNLQRENNSENYMFRI